MALRACILYDYEMGKEADISYRDLMSTFGRDFMERREFDSWREWFGSGEKRLEDREGPEPKRRAMARDPPRWAELPVNFCVRLIKMMELRDVLRFSKVCKPFRQIIQDFGLQCKILKLEVAGTHMVLTACNHRIRFDILEEEALIMLNGDAVKMIEAEEAVDMFLADFRFYFLNPGHKFDLLEVKIAENVLGFPAKLLEAMEDAKGVHMKRLVVNGSSDILEAMLIYDRSPYHKIILDFQYGLPVDLFWRTLSIRPIPDTNKCYDIYKILPTDDILHINSIPNGDRSYLAMNRYAGWDMIQKIHELNLRWEECEL
uniref:F-box domain-containing protein n=1 Tax=Caenorhabditis tropicalis TaxID=1561998 RepID=A0A1I7TVU3_9PELO